MFSSTSFFIIYCLMVVSPLWLPVECQFDASAFCFDCLSRHDPKDLYANPDDCHSYVQCFYTSDTTATGYVRRCPAGTFWNQTSLTCVRESTTDCKPHPCSDPVISAFDKYHIAGMPCNQYFFCSSSDVGCCPANTRFNSLTGNCDADPTCQDVCYSSPQSTLAPIQLSPTTCIDAYGNLLTGTEDASTFQLGGATLSCATGSLFDLITCRCNDFTAFPPASGSGNQCQLWLPFTNDLNDKSAKRFATFARDGAGWDGSISAVGSGGSLKVLGGNSCLNIPGLKTMDLGKEASWCYFFRCESQTNSFLCSQQAGVVSNNKDATNAAFTYVTFVQPTDRFTTMISAHTPTFTFGIPTQLPNGWHQICTVVNATKVVTYHNGVVADVQVVLAGLSIGHCPYVIGTDQFFGGFVGHIDEVLICNSALSSQAVQYHLNGNYLGMAGLGLIP